MMQSVKKQEVILTLLKTILHENYVLEGYCFSTLFDIKNKLAARFFCNKMKWYS